MAILYLDSETNSLTPIRRGTDVYLDSATPLLVTYAIDEGPIQVYDVTLGAEVPASLYEPLQDASFEIWCHNVFFDRMVLHKLLGFDIPVERFRCSQALALSHGLPGGLDPLCEVLGVPTEYAKIKDGRRLIQKFCCKPFVKDSEWSLFIQYAINDISALRDVKKRIPNWNYQGDELRLWHLDQTINNRGFAVDRQLAEGAVKLLAKQKVKADDWTNQATGGVVTAATQRDKLLFYLCEKQGCFLPDLKAATITAALEDESLEESTRDLLRVRLNASKTSGAKYKRMLSSVGKDGRLRGTLQFAGASRTARWAGRIFQPQNLPRPTMLVNDKDGSDPQCEIRHCINFIREDKGDLVSLFASPNEACSNALRGLIVAEEGKRLLVADYSAIEGRVNAWLAGETWKVKAFREGQDLYKLIYSRAFGVPVESVTKAQRQIGKVMELALGYGGGVGAFINMVGSYNIDLEELGRTVTPVAKALEAWERALSKNETFGLSKEVYVACDTLKIGYRKANPAIVASWYMYEEAVRRVIAAKLDTYTIQVGPLMFDCSEKWLRIRLPSGRYLCYNSPSIHKDGTISYMSWRNKTWSRTKTYGGKTCENLVQAIARDLLAAALLRVESAGYPVVLHVHDEPIAETASGSLAEFIKLVTTLPRWAAGLPVSATGFEGVRYEKS